MLMCVRWLELLPNFTLAAYYFNDLKIYETNVLLLLWRRSLTCNAKSWSFYLLPTVINGNSYMYDYNYLFNVQPHVKK